MTISKIIDSHSCWNRLLSFLWFAVIKKTSYKFLPRKSELVCTTIINTSLERKCSEISTLSFLKIWLSLWELFVSELIGYIWVIWLLFPVPSFVITRYFRKLKKKIIMYCPSVLFHVVVHDVHDDVRLHLNKWHKFSFCLKMSPLEL